MDLKDMEEIETVLTSMCTNCRVVETEHDGINYLVAYAQTAHTIQDLKRHCSNSLPFHMVPSFFVILDSLPVNKHGNVEQQNLPAPHFTSLLGSFNAAKLSQKEMEHRVQRLWYQVLSPIVSIPSISTPFFSFGDDPALFLRLFQLYSNHFEHNLPLTRFLDQPTIAEHARLLLDHLTSKTIDNKFHADNIIEAPASHMQLSTWLEDQNHLRSDKMRAAVSNLTYTYRLDPNNILSITRLRQALQRVVMKHQALRTSFTFDKESDLLTQKVMERVNNSTNLFKFIESIFETDEQLSSIVREEQCNPELFDIAQGLVFRCHLLHYKQLSLNDHLTDKDVLIFNFHGVIFDGASMNIFLRDLHHAYKTDAPLDNDDNANPGYIDYSVLEQQIPMPAATMFWLDNLSDCQLDRALPLPYDRYRLTNEHRTGRGTFVSFDFGQDLSHHLLTYALSLDMMPEHVALSAYFAFLYKLTSGERDLCIGLNTHGRYRDELKSMIGMFKSVIPLRCQLAPQWSFHKLIEHLLEITTLHMKYSYFPLRRILALHPDASSPAFLNTPFEFTSHTRQHDNTDAMIADSRLRSIPISVKTGEEEVVNTFDFLFSVKHDLNTNRLSCRIDASLDLFDEATVDRITQRFHTMLHHLFVSIDSEIRKPIYEFSITLPNERLLLQSLNNTQVIFPSVTCIHHEFVCQVMHYPQKLAAELDNQSLTYSELLYNVQVLSLNLINEHNIVSGEIVCQCIERSLSMVIGIMAIEMIGGVYCPLSPQDPQHRLHALVGQTGGGPILVHYLTKEKLNNVLLVDIDSILIDTNLPSDDIDRLSDVIVSFDSIAYIIFTSGSTGTPKVVQIEHRNLMACIDSDVHVKLFTSKDTMLQIASCSFDVHVQEIVGALVVGATSVLLRPQGNIDLKYVLKTLREKQISYIQSVPAYLNNMVEHLSTYNDSSLSTIQSIGIGGEKSTIPLIEKLYTCLPRNACVWSIYGPAEATINCTYHIIDRNIDITSVPIGRPFPNYRCLVLDDFLESVFVDQEGELFVGGGGVFVGYFGDDDLSAKILININNETFYRTGDLVRMDSYGLLHYIGRKDYQVKLRGQRIELGEIERCLLNTSISACVVIKWGDDHLVAYVQSSYIDEKQLRQHCQSHLPPHMIPSFFIILDKLPLTTNGKIDRKSLPAPDYLLSTLPALDESDAQFSQLEKSVHDIWCQVLKCDGQCISTTTSFFTVGGHSRLFIDLYLRYRTLFNFDAELLSVGAFIQQPTIAQHVKLLETITIDSIQMKQWQTLHINQSVASFAQERIFLDEQIRFSDRPAIYNGLIILRVVQGSLFRDRLLHVFRFVLSKHQILRTSLVSNINENALEQSLTNNHQTFTFDKEQTFKDDNELQYIIYQTTINPDLFDMSSGRVFNGQILQHQKTIAQTNSVDLIEDGDVLVIRFHHAAVDRTSIQIFLDDLYSAYNNDMTFSIDEHSLNYIDYTVHERLIDMTSSRDFWHSQLKEYNLEHSLLLPVDRHRLSADQRSNIASTAEITFSDDLLSSFLDYTSSHQVTPFQLALSIFYIFLLRLTHGQTDLCIASLNANRYRSELQNMVGMFVTLLPTRLQLDRHWSFDELVQHVRDMCVSILEHSYYPLQHILADFRLNQSNVPFLETLFDFNIVTSQFDEYSLNGACIEQVPVERSYEVATFDFYIMFTYNPALNNDKLSCSFVCSRDIFNETTVTIFARRLKYLIEQLFSVDPDISRMNTDQASIWKLDLILPEEIKEVDDVVFCRQTNVMNEAPASYAQARIWLDERIRFDPNDPQTAIYNMPFLYRLSLQHTLSLKQLHHALQLVVTKHSSLRTALFFDTYSKQLVQRIIDPNDSNHSLFTFVESTFQSEEQLNNIMHEEKRNSHLFDLSRGLVFRCHLVYHNRISANDLLSDKDALIFNFHHALFDFPSMDVFLHDLNQAYTTGQLSQDDNTTLRYLDYAVIEQQMPMTAARMFWFDTLRDCQFDRPLPLPYDRHRLTNEHRTGRGTSISFDLGQDLSHHLLTYASANNISPEHIVLACYYIFLFKLTSGERDLCIGINTHGRYRDELRSVIGMFVNAIPLRCQLDPHWSFHQLIEYVRETTASSMKYSYFPLQRILDQHPHISHPAFLDASFKFTSYVTENDQTDITIGDSRLTLTPFSIKINEEEIMSKFDFILTAQHDRDTNRLSCSIDASIDLFKRETIEKIAQRFHAMFRKLFEAADNQTTKSIYELSLLLPNERLLMQSTNNTQIVFSPITCTHHEFVCQAMEHPQKLAVELDAQSMTYSELLYFSQMLSLHLSTKYRISSGEVVCQCVERSFSMIIGMIAIEMVGGIYCPLSPRDPQRRLHQLIEQTQSRLVLVHWLTKTKFHNIVSCNIDSILTNKDEEKKENFNLLSDILITPEDIAYIIFTSGSTGTPKAVQLRHRNFVSYIRSYIIHSSDITLHHTSVTFDAHLSETLGTLMVGGQVVVLQSHGHLDMDLFSKTIQYHQVTYLGTVPSQLINIVTFLNSTNQHNTLETLRCISTGGESLFASTVVDIRRYLSKNCRFYNYYGPTECTEAAIEYLVPTDSVIMGAVPLGRPMANVQIYLVDNYLQPVIPQMQMGEVVIGGTGVFAGYRGREELMKQVLCKVDNEICYRTGDLGRFNTEIRSFEYYGRQDYQVKLRGQRIGLSEIETVIMNMVAMCVVIKIDHLGSDHLVAYVQKNGDIDEKQLRQHCESHLPPHMIPSFFVIVDQLPLNANGKIDRTLLRTLQFSPLSDEDDPNSVLLTPLEKQLKRIFCDAFHIESPGVTMSFGRMGGTSLDAIRALWLIRREIFTKVDAGLLFSNPSIRQLARAIEPLLDTQEDLTIATTTSQVEEKCDRPLPCLYIELFGISLLICQWISPIWFAYQSHSFLTLLFVPVFHLLSYVTCQRLLFSLREVENKMDELYSWHYYRWWFLNNMWSFNNSYWLKHLLGTPFYNSYLRLCGAKVGFHSHIYTTLIDAPWLIDVGEYTFIGEEVVLSSLSYQDQTYELHHIKIGSHCSINIRSALYQNVIIDNHVYTEAMSTITGLIRSSNQQIFMKDRLRSYSSALYQFTCLFVLLIIHYLLLLFAYKIYCYCLLILLPLPIAVAFSWLIWILTSLSVALFLLKSVIGTTTTGSYSLNSFQYLHKIWLRHLIITSFHYSLSFIPAYHDLGSVILRWLGAKVGEDVKLAELPQILYFPSNLLCIESGVTTFGGAKLASFLKTKEGLCCLDEIHLGSCSSLTNWCTLIPGTRLPSQTIVGSLTLVNKDTVSDDTNRILLGIPARQMPFSMPTSTSPINGLSSTSNSSSIRILLNTCALFLMSKYLIITLYSSLPIFLAPFIHLILCCIVFRYLSFSIKQHTQSNSIIFLQNFLDAFKSDFLQYVGSYLSGTQFLVFLFRRMSATIGCDVILPDIDCLTDPHLTTIGNHVRLQMGAHIQCHTFEQRFFKLAAVTVNQSCVIMSNALILSGSTLQGRNHVAPLTLVMKDDQLLPNTKWSGVPAQQV